MMARTAKLYICSNDYLFYKIIKNNFFKSVLCVFFWGDKRHYDPAILSILNWLLGIDLYKHKNLACFSHSLC